jgi:uncharacterized protein YndB with AHSA1/START domain
MSNATNITSPEGLPHIEIVREFDAPVAAVYKAHTTASLYEQWVGPAHVPTQCTVMDARPGGSWSFSSQPDGYPPFTFSGIYHAVVPNQLLIHTFEFSLAPNEVGLDFVSFEDLGNGRTRVSIKEIYPSVATRDMAVASGMTEGIEEGYVRLDGLLTGAAVAA